MCTRCTLLYIYTVKLDVSLDFVCVYDLCVSKIIVDHDYYSHRASRITIPVGKTWDSGSYKPFIIL